eukprot:3502626-Pyramimonas_sp.AAC.1
MTPMPINSKKGRLATRQPVATIPFYEVLARTFKVDEPTLLMHRSQPELLCKNFYDHAVVRQVGADLCIPARLFIDYAKLDGQASTLNMSRLRQTPPALRGHPRQRWIRIGLGHGGVIQTWRQIELVCEWKEEDRAMKRNILYCDT